MKKKQETKYQKKSKNENPSKNRNFKIIIVFFIIFLSLPAYADFEDLGAGARPFGMGNAFSALANDVNAVYYNPAGLAYLKNAQITTSYDRLYLGLSDKSSLGNGFIAITTPLGEMGGIGLSYLNFQLVDYYQEHTFTLSYANKIFSELSAGLNVKFLSRSISEDAYTRTDPLFLEKGYTKAGFSFDAGLLFRPFPSYSFAFTVYNINQPDLGLKDNDTVPIGLKLGFAYRYYTTDFVTDFAYSDKDWDLCFGVENWFFEGSFAIRGGVKTGSRADNDLSLGLGYNSGNLQFDYGFQFPLSGIKNTFGSHRVSFGIKFGEVSPESDSEFGYVSMVPESLLKEEVKKIKKEAENSSKTVQKLKYELDDYKRKLNEEIANGEKDKKSIKELKEKIDDYTKKVADVVKVEEKAKSKLEKVVAVEKVPDDQIMQKKNMLWEMGIDYYNEGQYEKATSFFEKILKYDPQHAEAKRMMEQAKQKLIASNQLTQNTYTVQKGDTLKSIAIKLYNDESRWSEIYELNKDRIKQGIVESGQILILPEEKK